MQRDEYDIVAAFQAIEDELIASMMRNMKRHRAEESKEGFEWSMWQAEQLRFLEEYKMRNQKKYGKQFKSLNSRIDELIRAARDEGGMQQEIQILNAIKKGFNGTKRAGQAMSAEFFKINDRKLDALIRATVQDMEKAETAILRKANDDYRKAIFNAQVYANTGAGTYEKAVDMATRDMLSRGLNCVEYANGARHTLSDYADMAIRTASKRAYLQGEGEKRQEWGIATVIVNKRGNPCPKCLPFCGKVLMDDVWSGGPKDGIDPETGKRYPLMSKAIAHGLYHPRCKDSHTTYFPGISTADDTWTNEELEAIGQANQDEVKRQYSARQAEKYERLTKYSLDEENQKRYAARREEWKRRQAEKSRTIQEQTNIEYDFKGSSERFTKSKTILEKLSKQYHTHLQKVMVGSEKSAGSVVMSGTVMNLSSAYDYNAIHEFAHTLANSNATKYGLSGFEHEEFWKEIKKIRREYMRTVGDDSSKWISSYEHSSKQIDEFFAEAFTQAKMTEMGLELPKKYGNDLTFSKKVLEVTDRYFRKDIGEIEFSPRKATKGSFGVDWPKVNSVEYKKKIEKLSDNPKVVSAIETRAKWMLNNRNGLKTEELYAICLEDGEQIASILGQQIESGVKRTKEFTRKMDAADKAGKKVLLLHNHPRGLPPSIGDLNALIRHKNVSGATIGHDGSIYYYTRPQKTIPETDFKIAIMKYLKYTETTGIEKALEELAEEYGFEVRKL